jgi:transketolase
MRGIPGMRVFCPSDRVELVSALPAIVADPHPWYVRYIDRPPLAPSPPFGIGRARRLRAGDDVTILTYGLLTEQVLSAAAILAERGVEATVVDVRTLDPIDTEAVLDALAAPLCVTVEDHFLTGGLATIAAEVALRHRITGHHLPVALDDRWYTATLLPRVLEAEGFTAQALAERITAALDSTA